MFYLDISPNALTLARKHFKEAKLPTRFVCGSIFEMPFKEGTFDIVWNVGVIEHFLEDDQCHCLREMSRICKENGLIITLVPNERSVLYRSGRDFRVKRKLWKLGYEKGLISLKELWKDIYGVEIVVID